jgi:transcriptional regulator with XRE-family HTH domain
MIGGKIIAARKKKGWSQKELASRIPIDQGHLAKLEGGRAPSGKTLSRIALALDLPIEHFLQTDIFHVDAFDEIAFNRKLRQIPTLSLNRKKALNVVLDALLDLTAVQKAIE